MQVVFHSHNGALRERELRLGVRQRGGPVQVHGRAGVQDNVAYGAHLRGHARCRGDILPTLRCLHGKRRVLDRPASQGGCQARRMNVLRKFVWVAEVQALYEAVTELTVKVSVVLERSTSKAAVRPAEHDM